MASKEPAEIGIILTPRQAEIAYNELLRNASNVEPETAHLIALLYAASVARVPKPERVALAQRLKEAVADWAPQCPRCRRRMEKIPGQDTAWRCSWETCGGEYWERLDRDKTKSIIECYLEDVKIPVKKHGGGSGGKRRRKPRPYKPSSVLITD
jgi:hypothetical protein